MDQFFGIGGSFDVEGEAGSFFGAYNQGSKLSASDTLVVVQDS